MVTTTERMLHRVHRHTTDLRPRVALDAVLVVVVAGLQHRLVHAAATGDNANNRAARRRDRLAGAAREADTRLVAILGVTDDDARRARGAGDRAAVTGLLLEGGDDRTLRKAANRHAVAHGQLRVPAAVDELARVDALDGDEELLRQLVAVRIAEDDTRERRATARIVDDLLHEALDEAIALRVVEAAELDGALAVLRLRLENAATTLTLTANEATHGGKLQDETNGREL